MPRSSPAGATAHRRSAVLVALLVGVSVLASGPRAEAVRIPETLADRKPVQAGPVAPGFPIDFVGVVWDTTSAGPAAPPVRAGEPFGAVRFLEDGTWGPWIPLIEDGAEGPGQWGSGLVSGDDAEAYQVRGIPASAGSPRAVALNTTDGPPITVGRRAGVSALADCVSRQEWGADESVMTWDAEFEPVQTLTVHHTATANGVTDPAATVRAIYHYHAVDRGWGDIAYHYLIDEAGGIYEGRWSGSRSTPCKGAGGGDTDPEPGDDFGHDSTDPASPTWGQLVTGGHTYNYNQGNVGIALLGDFTQVEPKPEARGALEAVLADLAGRHGLDPLDTVTYVNPTWGTSATVDMISGHRDWPSPAGDTACPGDTLYPLLPDIRLAVAAAMGLPVPEVSVAGISYATAGGRNGDKDLTVEITLDPPIADARVSATVSGPDGVSGTFVTDATGTASISIRNHRPGCYLTDVTSVAGTGRVWDGITPVNGYGCDPAPTPTTTTTTTPTSATTTSTTTTTTTTVGEVQIGAIDPAVVTAGPTPERVLITGAGFAAGATVTFSGGAGPAPTASNLEVSVTAISLDVVVRDGGPPKARIWDVTVTNPGGAAGTLAGGLTVVP